MYFVVSDVHSFWGPLEKALREAGFQRENPDHKLIVCGDMFDRGSDSYLCFRFIEELYKNNRLVYVKGNHEDLYSDCLYELKTSGTLSRHHIHNGTVKTIAEFCNMDEQVMLFKPYYLNTEIDFANYVENWIKKVTVNYFELGNYIFVHGWIPVVQKDGLPAYYAKNRKFEYNPDWRNASEEEWNNARWINGMDAYRKNIVEPGKTIVCGHWHCSYGWSMIKNKGSEFDLETACFDPFEDSGIIAIDACTAFTKKVNCIKFTNEGERVL